MTAISAQAQARIFKDARTHLAWQDRPVEASLLRELYDLMKMGPTSANCCPARFVFVTTDAGRERLRPHLIDGNVEQTMTAPVTVVVGYDRLFYELVPELFVHNPGAKDWFEGDEDNHSEHAFRNGTLQGAYLMLAARALGLDCGPMSGFDADGINKEFWPDGRYRANFLCNLGYGDASRLHPRLPRLDFDRVCELV